MASRLRDFEALLGKQSSDYSKLEAEFKAKEQDLNNKLNNNLRQASTSSVKNAIFVREFFRG